MRSQASAHKSARVSGNQTGVWKRSLYLLVASKDGGQSRVSSLQLFFPLLLVFLIFPLNAAICNFNLKLLNVCADVDTAVASTMGIWELINLVCF